MFDLNVSQSTLLFRYFLVVKRIYSFNMVQPVRFLLCDFFFTSKYRILITLDIG